MFLRPCFLVVDREFAGSISSRKLVLETAKFNVITAYSFEEARATLNRFPNLHAAVVTSDTEGRTEDFLRWMRSEHPAVRTVVTGASGVTAGVADRAVEGFAPDLLLRTLRELFPEEAHATDETERRLEVISGERPEMS